MKNLIVSITLLFASVGFAEKFENSDDMDVVILNGAQTPGGGDVVCGSAELRIERVWGPIKGFRRTSIYTAEMKIKTACRTNKLPEFK